MLDDDADNDDDDDDDAHHDVAAVPPVALEPDCDGGEDYYPSKSYETLLLHLSESCVRKYTIVFHELQAALLVVKPHADKMPVKVMPDTRRAVQ